VPYHLVRPENPDGPVPVLVHGYGGFGVSSLPHYTPVVGALWLERGGAYVVAHIRGGSELGPEWHLAAKGPGREKAFEDFAAIARDLAEAGISTPAQIACRGGSNGGLLTGVMLTRYPDLFGAIWSSVGLYDMLRFHEFPAGKVWIGEFGDPNDPKAAAWLRAYSPLHNIPGSDIRLPPTLLTTSDNDDRVDPSHARRFAAALKDKGHRPTFYQHGGGHGGGGSSRSRAREAALGYGFLAKHLELA
jgi:prolyl oligopeptidase